MSNIFSFLTTCGLMPDILLLATGVTVLLLLVFRPRTACAEELPENAVHDASMAVPVPVLAVDGETMLLAGANPAFIRQYGEYPVGMPVSGLETEGSKLDFFLRETLAALPPVQTESVWHPPSTEISSILLLWNNSQAYVQFPVRAEVFTIVQRHGKTILYVALSSIATGSAHCLRTSYNTSTTNMFLYLDAQERIINCNRQFELLAQRSFQDLFGKTLEESALPKKMATAIAQDTATVVQCAMPLFTETAIAFEGGGGAVFECQTHPDISPVNEIQGVFTVWRDTQQDNSAVQLLQRQEKLLHAAVDSALYLFSDSLNIENIVPQVLETVGQATSSSLIDIWRNHQGENGLQATRLFRWPALPGTGRMQSFSETLSYEEDLRGWESLLASGKSISALHHSFPEAEKRHLVEEGITAILIVPVIFQSQFWGFMRLGTRNNQRKWSSGEKTILHSIGIFLTSSMHQKHVQNALLQSDQRFQDVSIATGEIIWELDGQGYISYVSSRVYTLTGYAQEELLGTRFEDYSLGEEQENITGQMFQLGVLQGSFNGFEHRFRAKDGKILWFRTSGLLLAGENGLGGLRSTSLDITQQKYDAEQLKDTMRQLKEANGDLKKAVQQAKNLAAQAEFATRAKDDFIANISHELRTPLNAIIGMTYLALKTEMTPKQKDYVEKIHSAGTSLLGIVNDILDFSKAQAGAIVLSQIPFSLHKVFDNVVAVTGLRANAQKLDMIMHIGRNVPDDLIGDPIRFEQILTNIVGNAVKFTEKGCISVRCSISRQEPGSIHLTTVVRDTGVGMSQNQLDNLFNAFSQADSSLTRRFGGTGLGLVLAKSLLTLAGGSIHVDSKLKSGTTVTFTMPFQTDFEVFPEDEARKVTPTPVVLLGQDGPFRNAIAAMLEDYSCAVSEFSEISQAFLHIEKKDMTDSPCRAFIIPHSLLEEHGNTNLAHLFETMMLSNPPSVIAIVPFSYSEDHPALQKYRNIKLVYKPVTAQALCRVILRGNESELAQGSQQDQPDLPYFPNVNVLLAEDNPINQQLVTELLREIGIHTVVADTGKQALELLEEAGPSAFDLIFMDLQMPEMDGYTTTKRLRQNEKFAEIPVVAMTAHASKEEIDRCFTAGMNAHLAKPLNINKLHSLLSRWLEPGSAKGCPGNEGTQPEANVPEDESHAAGIDYQDLHDKLRHLNALLKDDDAESCTVFHSIENQLSRFDEKGTQEAADALAVFDFSLALTFLEPMEHGIEVLHGHQTMEKE